jgi:hypothetical protein
VVIMSTSNDDWKIKVEVTLATIQKDVEYIKRWGISALFTLVLAIISTLFSMIHR